MKKRHLNNQGSSYCIPLRWSCLVFNPGFDLHVGSQRKNSRFAGDFPSIKKDLSVQIPLLHSILACLEFSSIPFVTPSHFFPFLHHPPSLPVKFTFWRATAAAVFFQSLPLLPPSHLPDSNISFYYSNLMFGLLWHDLLKHN